MKTEMKAMIATCAAYTIFGLSFLFSKMALGYTEPSILLWVRFTLTFLVLNLMIPLKMGRLNLKGKKLTPIILLGVLQPGLYYILENYGLKYTTTSFTGLVAAVSPVLTIVLGAVILRERPNLRQWICVAVSILGVLAISLMNDSSGTNTAVGCLCLLGAYTAGSLYSIISRKNSQDFTPFEMTYVMFAVGFVIFTALAFGQYGSETLSQAGAALSVPSFCIGVVYLGVLSSVAAFLLMNYALAHLPVALATIFGNLSTVISVLAGIIVMGDPFSPAQAVFAVMILAGVWGVNHFRKREA